MSRYIQQIVRYFFHHDVKDEIATRVQDRLVLGGDVADDADRDHAFSSVDDFNGAGVEMVDDLYSQG